MANYYVKRRKRMELQARLAGYFEFADWNRQTAELLESQGKHKAPDMFRTVKELERQRMNNG